MTTAILKKLDEMKDVKGISLHTEKGAIKFVPESHAEKLEKALRIAVERLESIIEVESFLGECPDGIDNRSVLLVDCEITISQIADVLGVEE